MTTSTILSDNGATSGSAGLKTTGGNDGTLVIQTTTAGGTATTAMTLGTDQSVTFAQAANLPNTFGFKNRIINGAMMIDQRNAGASVTIPATAQYTVDRWQASASQASKFTVQQNAGAITPPSGFSNYVGVTSSSAYSVLSTDYFQLTQIVEANNITDFAFGTTAAQPVTLSFWVRSSLTGTFGASLAGTPNAGATVRSYPFTYTINSANTWEQKTITFVGDSAINTWYTGTQAGLFVRFGLGCGSTYLGTAGAWATGNFIQPTGTVSVVGTNGATFYITGVQLEKGSTATSFDYRPYGTELQLCQRYYEYNAWLQNSGNSANNPFYQWTLYYQVEKRAAATLTTNAGTYTTATGSSTPVYSSGTTRSFVATPANSQTWSSVSITWYASAEL